MTDFDVDVDDINVREALEGLKDDWATDLEFSVGTNREYAVYLEFGRGPIEAQDADALQFENEDGETIYRTSVDGHPPYPFFRPAIREFKANPENVLRDNTGFDSLEQIPDGDTLIRAVAEALANQMKKNASADSATNRSPGTDSDHPKRQTGTLVASIKAQPV